MTSPDRWTQGRDAAAKAAADYLGRLEAAWSDNNPAIYGRKNAAREIIAAIRQLQPSDAEKNNDQ